MKNNQLIKSVAIFSLLTFLMMLTLSQLALSAESASAQEATRTDSTPAQTSVEAAKTGAFYDCVHSRKNNYFWTMSVSKSLPQGATSKMTVEQLAAYNGPGEQVAALAMDSAQKSIARLVGKLVGNVSEPDENFNLTEEFSHSVRLFGRYLRMRLKSDISKGLVIKEPIQFEILFAPRLSDALLDARQDNDIPRLSVYPLDRVLIADKLSTESNYNSYTTHKEKSALDGITSLMISAMGCGEQAGIHQAYPAAVLVKMSINPDIDSSEIMSQFVVGMPTGQSISFTQSNKEITFQTIQFPDNVTVKDKGNMTDFAYFHFPVAFVNISSRLDSTVIPIHIAFGNMGPMGEDGFQRPGGMIDNKMSSLPKLVGVPGDKDSDKFMENFKKKLVVNFNIYNLALSLDYSKGKVMKKEPVQVNELELLVSAGANRFPGFTFGKFNVKSVNDQFKSEINKAIVAQIDAQEAAVKKKIEDAKGVAAEKSGLSNEQIEGIIGTIFSKTRSASAGSK